jgi:thymidylate kinase
MALIVGLTGIDGAGKSAVARAAQERLRAHGQRVLYHHELEMVLFRPLFRMVGRLFGRRRSEGARDRFIGASVRPGLAADAYFAMLWVDSLIALAWFRLRPGVVLHDRWLYDQLVLMDRIGYSRRLVRWLYARFPRPDRMVHLRVAPATAMARKAADPGHRDDRLEFFETGARRIEALAAAYAADAVLDAEQPMEAVSEELTTYVERWLGTGTASAASRVRR